MNLDSQRKIDGLAHELELSSQELCHIMQGHGKTADEDTAFLVYSKLDDAVGLVRTAAEALLTGPRDS